jgi:mono/diheme cytochrome c family protein
MHAHSFSASSALLLSAACLAVALAGCRSLPPSKPSSEWTPEEARGALVYQVKCARCHYPTTTRPLNGPGLQALTKIKAMPSGAPPTDERLTAVILHGRGMMPSTPQLTDDQISDLLAYLHTL